MLQPNNSEIDYTTLERAIERTARYGRHTTPTVPILPVAAKPRLTFRQKVRLWPVLGPLLANWYHRARLMRAPGVPWQQRVRATPLLGDVAAWAYSLVTLPRWRQTMRDELTIAQQQVGALRRGQQELLDEISVLKQQLDDLQQRDSQRPHA